MDKKWFLSGVRKLVASGTLTAVTVVAAAAFNSVQTCSAASVQSYTFESTLGNGTVTFDPSNYTVDTFTGASWAVYHDPTGSLEFKGVTYNDIDFFLYNDAVANDGFNNDQGFDGFAIQTSLNGTSLVSVIARGPTDIISGTDLPSLLTALSSFDLITDRPFGYAAQYPGTLARGTVESFTAAVPLPSSAAMGVVCIASVGLMARRQRAL